MKKQLKTMIRCGMAALAFVIISVGAFAQKLKAVQEGSVWAPANVKVDAKLNEWGDNFQAYNNATDVFYTIANDDANLYIVMRSTDQTNNNKIIGGGINITINTAGKKKDKDAYVIMFPVVDLATLRSQIMAGMRSRGGTPGQPLDSAAIAGMRKKAVAAAKQIKLLGFISDVPDTTISIYNEYGIKALIDFDSKGSLVLEMAMPLKYLHISTAKESEFAYNIKLNGIQLNSIFPGAANMSFGGPGGAPGGGGGGGFGGGGGGGMPSGANMPRGMADIASMLSPTDFWGKYTLARNIKLAK